jgi:hypothetical protein
MTPTTSPRARRNAKTAAIGAVALTAAVALPAFAIDRGGERAVESVTAADAVESPTTSTSAAPTTTTTVDPEVAAFFEANATNEWLATLDTLTPEQQFEILSKDWTPEQHAAFDEYTTHQAELDSFYALVSWSTGVARAEAAASRSSSSGSSSGSGSGSVWDSLAQCETGGNWSHPTVSGGFSGGLMFYSGTWNANGGQEFASSASGASREEQIVVAERILSNSGWGAWPGCSRKLGLR